MLTAITFARAQFMEWSKQYGPVISLKLFGSNMVVLNDATSVREILDRRSATSSDRPPMHINDDVRATDFASGDEESGSRADKNPSSSCLLIDRASWDLDFVLLASRQLIAKGSHILLANGQRSALYRRMWNITLAKERVADHLPLQHAEGNAVLYNVSHPVCAPAPVDENRAHAFPRPLPRCSLRS